MIIINIYYNLILGLFQKAIMQSGCAFNQWALNKNHRASALKLANNLGCLSSDPKKIVKCLKNVSAIDLVKETQFKVCKYRILTSFFTGTNTQTHTN